MTKGIGSTRRSLAWQAVGTMALAAGLGSVAHAAEEPLLLAANEVRPVVVHGQTGGLNQETGLSTMPTTLQDTPQVANVIPEQQLKQQKIVTLEQALRNVPGITVSIGEGGTLNGDQFRIRGQEAQNDVYLDGLRDFGVYTRDSFNFQEVQVLKGPSGALFGRGTTGGVINTISKMAHPGDAAALEAAAGTAEYFRATADVNHAFNETTALRLNLMGNSNHVAERDLIRSRRWGAAASLGFGLGTQTSVLINVLHQHDNRIPDYGMIILQPPGSLVAKPASEYGAPRTNFLGTVDDIDRTTANILTVKFSHSAGPLTVTSDSRVGVYDRYFQYSTLDNCNAACVTNFFDGDPATEPYGGYGGSGPYFQDAWGAQNVTALRYEGELFGLKTQLIGGTDVSYQDNKRELLAYSLPPGITVRNTMPRAILHPDPAMPAGYAVITPTPANIAGSSATLTTVRFMDGNSTDFGAFATGRFWLAPQWSLMGSLRVDSYKAEFNTVTVGGTYAPLKSDSTLVNPRVALMFEPTDTETLYLSWGRSATPQGTAIVANATGIAPATKDLEPEKNETFEAGAKVGILGGRASATAAAFYIKKNNATQTDPATGFLLAQSGERQVIKGVELGLIGRLATGWTVNAAYAYVDSEIKEAFVACSPTGIACPAGAPASTPVPNIYTIGRQVLLTPKHSGAVFTSYEVMDGQLEGLSFGGGATYQQGFPTGYTLGTTGLTKIAYVPKSISFDAFVAYEWDRFRVALNASNLANRLNYTQAFSNRAVTSPGRTFILTAGARF